MRHEVLGDDFKHRFEKKIGSSVIQPAHLWNSIANLALTQNTELLKHPVVTGWVCGEGAGNNSRGRVCSPVIMHPLGR
jgi:hypothetical protein